MIGEISLLRAGSFLQVNHHHSNRYRLILQEEDGSSTAYCFSTPIYNSRSGKLLDFVFRQNGDVLYATGSNSNITISCDVLIENAEGSCRYYISKESIS